MHEPVLVEEIIDLLQVRSGGFYIDGTAGSGGHSSAILQAAEESVVLAIDRDAEAVERSRSRLSEFGERVEVAHGVFADMAAIAGERDVSGVDGVLLDLGVSSEQLDVGSRGFSIRNNGPLDMRMDAESGVTAESIVNNADDIELAGIFRKYGEERRSMSVARAIVRARDKAPIVTTGQLADIAERALGGKRGKTHPATRIFQALRIFINGELDMLEQGLVAGLELLAPGGRFAVISYHSLEDRIVKHFFKAHAGRWESLQAGGREWIGEDPAVKVITRKLVQPSDKEIVDNSRARSAKLRVAERI